MSTLLDFIVFGATGQVGRYTLPYLYKLTKEDGCSFTWGIAGRNEEKLKAVLEKTANKIGDDLHHVPIIIADVNDENSIKQMTLRARVILNACGPYLLYGEVVVKCCLQTGTHYVDVSGEMLFVESMELKYHQAAKDKGVYMVTGCGFHSLPPDVVTVYLEQHFKGTLNSVEIYIDMHKEDWETENINTMIPSLWLSCITSLSRYSEIAQVRKKLFPAPLPECNPKLSYRPLLHKPKISNKWAMPFPATDCDVIARSQRYFYERNGKRPLQTTYYLFLDSFIYGILSFLYAITFGVLIYLLAQFKLGKMLLLHYPRFFCLNYFTYKDYPEELLNNELCTFTAVGRGWDEKLADGQDQYKTPPNKVIVAEIKGRNPGYGLTCACFTVSGILLLTEPEKLPPKGGIYTTAAAFEKTSIIEQLQKNDVHFRILK